MARLYINPINPIALREMKTRMRGPRSFALLIAYLSILGLVIYVVYLRKGAGTAYNYGGILSSGNYGPTRSFETGQDIFISIFMYLIIMVSVITPAVCGGLVSREMEDRTYDMLVVTPLRGRTLVYGKLLGSLGYMIMLLLGAIPLVCIVYVFGGVAIKDVIAGFAIVLMLTIVTGIISLFFSGLFQRTSIAIIVTYGLIAFLLLGVPLISASIVATINADTGRLTFSNQNNRLDSRSDPAFDFSKRMLVFNPQAALGSVLAPNAPYRPGNNEELQFFPNSRIYGGNPNTYYATPSFPPNSSGEAAWARSKLPVLPNSIPLWQGYLLVYTAIGLFFLILSSGVVKPLPRRPGFNPFRRLTHLAPAGGVKFARTRKPARPVISPEKDESAASLEEVSISPAPEKAASEEKLPEA